MEKKKKMENRKRIIEEIIETEKTYLNHLTLLSENYQAPLLKKKYLTTEESTSIFSNLTSLLDLHKIFLKDLEEGLEKNKIAEVFEKNSQIFKLYTDYINNFESGVAKIKNLSKSSKFKNQLIQLKKESSSNLDFDSLYISPIQRIPRYQLLISQLLKETEEQSQDHPKIKRAFLSISETANYLNETKRKKENTKQMFSLDKKLIGKKNFDV